MCDPPLLVAYFHGSLGTELPSYEDLVVICFLESAIRGEKRYQPDIKLLVFELCIGYVSLLCV